MSYMFELNMTSYLEFYFVYILVFLILWFQVSCTLGLCCKSSWFWG